MDLLWILELPTSLYFQGRWQDGVVGPPLSTFLHPVVFIRYGECLSSAEPVMPTSRSNSAR
jgi:hypothetical protein